MSDNEKRETHADIIAEMHRFAKQHEYDHPDMDTNARGIEDYADRLEAAHRREIDEIVSAVSELREGMCLHCDLQDQCADGEDGKPTTCNAMAKVNNFINRYKKVEALDECPF